MTDRDPLSATVPDLVTDAVLQASRAMVAIVARSVAAIADDVTFVQFRALVVLRGAPNSNLAHLADELGVTASSATRMCDRLVERGLVRREAAPESRREIRLSLTAPGRHLVDRATGARRQGLQRVLADMPARDRERLVPVLQEFTHATSRTPGLTWPGADTGLGSGSLP